MAKTEKKRRQKEKKKKKKKRKEILETTGNFTESVLVYPYCRTGSHSK